MFRTALNVIKATVETSHLKCVALLSPAGLEDHLSKMRCLVSASVDEVCQCSSKDPDLLGLCSEYYVTLLIHAKNKGPF